MSHICTCGHSMFDHANLGNGPCLAGMAHHCSHFTARRPKAKRRKSNRKSGIELQARRDAERNAEMRNIIMGE